ncbi:MAG: hypothetical protein HKP27_03925 [Myxococcales bacterium]|nr:hypothetical protein [Myxococcales bacterium]
MTLPVLLLTAAYVAIAALLLNLNLASPHSRVIKLLSVVLVTTLYLGTWHGLFGMLGWPNPRALPESFRVLWIEVDDPDKQGGDPGAIYLWVRDVDEQGRVVGRPRAYGMPWSKQVADSAQTALSELTNGVLLNGSLNDATDEPTEAEGEGTSNTAADGPVLPNPEEDRVPFEFRPVERPTLPPKGLPDF